MVSLKAVFLASTVATGALAHPFDFQEVHDNGNAVALERRSTAPSSGTHNGYFYSWWTDGEGDVEFTLGEDSQYSVAWTNSGNFVGGVGWDVGSGRTISFNGTWDVQGNGYLSVYGWTQSPLVEYYVVESFGSYDPGNGAHFEGSFESDGATYKVYHTTRVGLPSTVGLQGTLERYWSVRQEKRISGSVNMQNHFDAWTSFDLELGAHDYQIVATEGYYSNGTSEIYVETS